MLLTKILGVNQGKIFYTKVDYRRILGLTPEYNSENIEDDQTLVEKKPIVSLPKPAKSVYVDFDMTGMEKPIHVDGSYHGYAFFSILIDRWIDPQVCDRYNLPKKEGEESNHKIETQEQEPSQEQSQEQSKENTPGKVKRTRKIAVSFNSCGYK